MKIAFCVYKFFPYGGLQRDFYRIAEELANRGHEIRVYVQSWKGADVPVFMDLHIVPTTSLTNHGKNTQYYKWVRQHLAEYPVDRVVGFNKMPGLDVYYAADTCYAEKVANEKGFFYKLSGRCRHYSRFEAETVKRGRKTKLMIIAPRQKTEFQKYYQTEDERFYLLPPGIAPDRKFTNFPAGTRQDFRQEFGLKESDILMVQIGSDFHRKGVDRSIRALASLKSEQRQKVFLYVIGQDKAEKFSDLADSLGVSKQVKIFNGRDDVPRFIASADLLLHPARSENTGTVILEAMAGGLPQIVTQECGYSPYVTRAKSGFVISSPYSQPEFDGLLAKALQEGQIDDWKANARNFAIHEDLYSLPKKAADIILKC